jgi:rfaE bifunctional protein kinase chain/domain
VEVDYKNITSSFTNLNCLVIGDVMIDSYLWGTVERISPEAPVPVVQMTKRENRLGGAANVAKNLKSLGAKAILCAVIGNDEKSITFKELMRSNHLTLDGIVQEDHRPTTTKTRIIAGTQQILRVDQEITQNISTETYNLLQKKISNLILSDKIDVVIFEDYDKGVISKDLIQYTVELCKQRNIPTCVDPKKKNFSAYSDVTLFKPNLKELKEGTHLEIDPQNLNDLTKAAHRLINKHGHESILITLSNHGVFIADKQTAHHFPAHLRKISDVSGAGDTVISVASLCLALGLDLDKIAQLSNIAGGMVCEMLGVVPLERDKFQKEINTLI